MVEIKNFGGNSLKEYQREVDNGGKFVIYNYSISIIVYSWKASSGIYLVRGHESAALKGWFFTLVSLLLGWWGIPWGPIFTIQSIGKNLSGGHDVTLEVMSEAERNFNPMSQYF